MNLKKKNKNCLIAFTLITSLVLVFFDGESMKAQSSQKISEELLLEIMDLHSELVTNETFLAQAKMLGAYLDAAKDFEEAKKASVYEKVLKILMKIKDVRVQPSSKVEQSKSDVEKRTQEKESETEKKTFEGEQKGKSVFEPGAAILEIFKCTGHEDSLDNIPDLPIIRTYWKSGLTCSSSFLLPERLAEVGEDSLYVGKFSFYYEAKQPGKYGFTIQHNENNVGVLKIGDVTVIEPPQETGRSGIGGIRRRIIPPVYQGVCNLGKGFHRIEFLLLSRVDSSTWSKNAVFQVKILTPDAFDAVPITKDMMLLKKE